MAAAFSTNPAIQEEALKRRIVFASPNTLMVMLRVVERLWARDTLQRRVQIIADEAGKVVDAVILLKDRFDDIERAIQKTTASYNTAKSALDGTTQSVLFRARRLVEAGAKGRKAIPDLLRSNDEEEAAPLLESIGEAS
jgi:DNA recombination protein RmuC